MISGYVKCGQGQKALDLFQQMHQEGVELDPITLVRVVNVCASVVALDKGMRAHELIMQHTFHMSKYHSIPSNKIPCWHLIEHWYEALELFPKMQQEGVQPGPVTFIGVLNACASVVALEEGRQVHEQIIENGCESDVFVGNSVIHMYAKCGSMDDACNVFIKMPSWDVVSWNSILAGFAMHGHGNKALEHFKQMCEEGVMPDDVTFVCILSACSHAGLVDEGMHLYGSMTETYMISAKVGHYACMVDLLGRAGHLREAENMIKGMPCKPNADVWRALLSACRFHGNVEMGEHAAQQVLELDSENAAGYVLLSNIYAADGNWNLSENVQRQKGKEVC